MKKILLIIVTTSSLNSLAQVGDQEYIPDHTTGHATVLHDGGTPRQYYKNLQKYWFYRYRLVNDFMIVGELEGMSIPCQARRWDHEGLHTHSLDFTDAPVQLGHYMQMLSTEHQQLINYNLPTTRSDYELSLAIDAVNRIDRWAELFSYNMQNNIGTFPGYPLSGYPGFPISPMVPSMPSMAPLNGFFLRDDVPYTAWFSENYTTNYITGLGTLTDYEYCRRHFNRPGLNTRNFIKKDLSFPYSTYGIYGTAFEARYDGADPYDDPTGLNEVVSPWPYSAPRVPQPESQDHLVEIAAGLAFASKFFPTGTPISNNAKSALARCLRYPFQYSMGKIKDPINHECVFGGAPGTYPGCDAGGANFLPCIRPSRRILHVYASASTGLPGFFIGEASAFQLMKFATPVCVPTSLGYISHSGYYAGLFASMVKGWHTFYVENTKPYLWNMSMGNFYAFPHLPLIYKIFNTDYTSFSEPYIRYLLDFAPTCGPHAHWLGGGAYPTGMPNLEWSGNDRLHEPFHRKFLCEPGFGNAEDADYNGLDYMLLFNLFAMTQGTYYMPAMNNPYYDDNYNVNYPDNNDYGSSTHPLKLNFLQYVAFNSVFSSDAVVTVRTGQTELLTAGTTVTHPCPTCSVTFIVDDYNCETDDYNFASLGKYVPGKGGDSILIYEPIEYFPHAQGYTAPDFYNPALNGTDSMTDIDPRILLQERNDIICETFQSGDLERIELVKQIFSQDTINVALRDCPLSINAEIKAIECTLAPNPTADNAVLSYQLYAPAYVSVKLTNMLGQELPSKVEPFDQNQEPGDHNITINSAGLASGCYYVIVTINGLSITKKLIVL